MKGAVVRLRPSFDAASPTRLANVQALRGVAALLVLGMHAVGRQVRSFGAEGVAMREAARVARSIGHLGVDLFFVISGFIIFMVVARTAPPSPRGPDRVRAATWFAWRRALRIYPLYWVTCAVMIALAAAAPEASESVPRPPVLPQLLLMTRAIDVSPVAWTLAFEMYFYAVVAACILAFGTRATVGIASWIAAEAAIVVLWNDPTNPSWVRPIVVDPMVLEFALGCGVAVLVQRHPRLPARALLLAAVAPITIGVWQVHARLGATGQLDGPWLRLTWFGTGAALLLAGVVLAELRGAWVAPRWLQAVGDASYSLYLWHIPVIVALGELGRRAPGAWTKGGPVMAMLDAATALVVAFLSYRWIERPLLDRRRSRREATAAARAA